MKRSRTTVYVLLAALALLGDASAAPPQVLRCEVAGTIDAGSAAYLESCVQEAERGYAALLLRLDTPGGALESTRHIARAFLNAHVPVLVWVGPSGARAGSAGVFVTYASHLAAMAPGTNIGAAHPVAGPTGADPDEAGGKAMGAKVVNDAVAFAQALAQARGRNAEWAEQAVRESASVTAERAVELKVVELVAGTEAAFLEAANGRTVRLPDGEVTLQTVNARLVQYDPTPGQRLLHWLANPALAYLLFVIGGLGLAIELSNPGLFVPGIVGLVCMVLAMIAFSALPVQLGAVALLVIGIGMIVAELFVGNGLLAVGGAILMGVGGVLLIDRFDADWFVEPSFAVPVRLVLPSVLLFGGAAALVMVRAARTRVLPQRGGDLGLIGEAGRALTEVGPASGEVFVHGERWQARSAQPVRAGAPIKVKGITGLVLEIEEGQA
ncbi:MAG: NfeD family protein [Myxococcales bacterium]